MSTLREPSGDLCDVKDHGHSRIACGGLCVGHADIPIERHGVPFTIELALCQLHWDELLAADDRSELARTWAS